MSNITKNTEPIKSDAELEQSEAVSKKQIPQEIAALVNTDEEKESVNKASLGKRKGSVGSKHKGKRHSSAHRGSSSAKKSGRKGHKKTLDEKAKAKRRRKRKAEQNGVAVIAISACLIMLALLMFSVAVLMGFMGDIARVEQLDNGITINLMNKANRLTIVGYVTKTREITSLNNRYTEIVNDYLNGSELDTQALKDCRKTLSALRQGCDTPYENLSEYRDSCMAVLDDLEAIGDEFLSLGSIKQYKIDSDTSSKINTLIKDKDAAVDEMSDTLTRTFETNGITYSIAEDGTINYSFK